MRTSDQLSPRTAMTMSCTRKRQPSLIRRRSLLKRKKNPRCNFPNKYVSTERRNRAFIYTVVHMQTERARAAGGLSRRVESLVSTAGGIERGGLPCSPANLAGLGKMKNRTDERRGTQRGHSQNMKKKKCSAQALRRLSFLPFPPNSCAMLDRKLRPSGSRCSCRGVK